MEQAWRLWVLTEHRPLWQRKIKRTKKKTVELIDLLAYVDMLIKKQGKAADNDDDHEQVQLSVI